MSRCVSQYDFCIPQGTDLTVPFRLKDSEGKAIDLHGYTVRMQVRKFAVSDVCIDDLTTENGRIALDEAEGTFTLTFPNKVTEAYPVGDVVYDIELVSADDFVTRIVEGSIRVLSEVTRGNTQGSRGYGGTSIA